uniref:Uncharacterized protein n=3 Tax=unclassified Kuttervirus TaxID=2770329 RepID=A0AAU8GIQ2_9CAUD
MQIAFSVLTISGSIPDALSQTPNTRNCCE